MRRWPCSRLMTSNGCNGKPFADCAIGDPIRSWWSTSGSANAGSAPATCSSAWRRIQFESGYPYIMFEDYLLVNCASPVAGRVTMSNLCSRSCRSVRRPLYNEDPGLAPAIVVFLQPRLAGTSPIPRTADSGRTIATAVRAYRCVSDMSDIQSVPSVAAGNAASYAIGLVMESARLPGAGALLTAARRGWTSPISTYTGTASRCAP